MKPLVTFVFTIFMLTIVAKKPVFDSIKTYESASIHFKKKTQGLFDDKNKKYIVPISNVEIYELANGFYGIADPKTRLVQIIFHNEHYTFKTSWQTKQMVLDNSTNFEYAGIFQTSNFTALQMEDVMIVEEGKGFINSKLDTTSLNLYKTFVYLGYYENSFFVFRQEDLQKTKPNSNKKTIGHVDFYTLEKKGKKKTTLNNVELYKTNNLMNLVPYSIDSTLKEEHISNEYENYIKSYYYYDFKVISLQTSLEYPIKIDGDAAFLNCSDKYKDGSYSDTLCQLFYSDNQIELNQYYKQYFENYINLKATNQSFTSNPLFKSTMMIETYNGIKLYDVNSKYILIETLNGTKNALVFDSSKSTQTRNCNNEMDFTLTYIDKENVLLSWYVYGVGQSSGLWNLTSKTWSIAPSNIALWYFENYFIQEKYTQQDDVEPLFAGYEIFDLKGVKVFDFDNTIEKNKLLNSILKVDSSRINENFVFTYKNGKKGLLKLEPFGLFPKRIFNEEYDEISFSAHSDLFMTIKNSTVDFIKLHNAYNLNKEYLIHYNLNAHKLGFSIYSQDYMFGDFNISNMGIILDFENNTSYNTNKDFLTGNHNFGYEKDQNHNFIIHNVKEKEFSSVASYDEYGEPADNNYDGVQDYIDIIYPNKSSSGVYSTKQKKWIIAPNKNWIGEFNGNYLTNVYSTENTLKFELFDSKGNFQSYIFDIGTDNTLELKKLFSADSVAQIGINFYEIYTKNDHYVFEIDFFELNNVPISIVEIYKNDYFMYNLNSQFKGNHFFLCKNEKGYFYNLKDNQNGIDSILPIKYDHYMLMSNKAKYMTSGDTLRYNSNEKNAIQLIEKMNNELNYHNNFGKIKLNNIHTMIVNYSESDLMIAPYFDDLGNETDQLFYFYEMGTYSTGIFNDEKNKWEILPQYEKIIPTELGYTAVKRVDNFTFTNLDNHNDSSPEILKTYSYDLYDKNFNLIKQFNQDANHFKDPLNLKFFVSDVYYDSIYELVNEHLGPQTIYARQIANSKHYIYYNKEKGYGALSHWTDNNKFTKTENYFETINYNPYFDCAIGVRSDSLFINDFSLKLIPQSTIEIFNNGGRNYHFNIRETLPNGVFEYTFDEETKKWIKNVQPVESTFGYSDGVYLPPVASISIYENEIIINHLSRTIEEVFEDEMYLYNDYNEYNINRYEGKTSNDEVWKKINGQWKCVLNEGTVTKCDKGYVLIKPELSQTYFNWDTKETSQLVDNQLKPIIFEKYTNPIYYYTLEKGYYFIIFNNENESARKAVCYSPSGKVISENFDSYVIIDGKIMGTSIKYDENGDLIEERVDYFEMTE